MTDEIANTVAQAQRITTEEQKRYEAQEEELLARAGTINRKRPKYLVHRGRKGYY
jgi:hypothetical protein